VFGYTLFVLHGILNYFHVFSSSSCLILYVVWDTAGLLIDNHGKTHMIFIWSVLYSRCVSFVMICSGTFTWSRCCGLLGRRLEHECAVHLCVGNPVRWQHGSRRLWQWSDGSSLSVSEQGTRAAGSEMAANGPQPPCTRTVS